MLCPHQNSVGYAWGTTGPLQCPKHALPPSQAASIHAWFFLSQPLEALQLPSKIHGNKVSHLYKPLKSGADTFTDAHQGVGKVSTGTVSTGTVLPEEREGQLLCGEKVGLHSSQK